SRGSNDRGQPASADCSGSERRAGARPGPATRRQARRPAPRAGRESCSTLAPSAARPGCPKYLRCRRKQSLPYSWHASERSVRKRSVTTLLEHLVVQPGPAIKAVRDHGRGHHIALETAGRGQQVRYLRWDFRIGRIVVTLPEDLLDLLRQHELDQQFAGVRTRAAAKQYNNVQADRDRLHWQPIDGSPFLGTDLRMVVEDLQRDRILARHHLVEDRPGAGVDRDDVLLAQSAQIGNSLFFTHRGQDVANETLRTGDVVALPRHLSFPLRIEQRLVGPRCFRLLHQAGVV